MICDGVWSEADVCSGGTAGAEDKELGTNTTDEVIGGGVGLVVDTASVACSGKAWLRDASPVVRDVTEKVCSGRAPPMIRLNVVLCGGLGVFDFVLVAFSSSESESLPSDLSSRAASRRLLSRALRAVDSPLSLTSFALRTPTCRISRRDENLSSCFLIQTCQFPSSLMHEALTYLRSRNSAGTFAVRSGMAHNGTIAKSRDNLPERIRIDVGESDASTKFRSSLRSVKFSQGKRLGWMNKNSRRSPVLVISRPPLCLSL